MLDERYDAGMRVRREVLGDAHKDILASKPAAAPPPGSPEEQQ